MEHNTDRILWTVLVLAIGISLYAIFYPAANDLLGQVTEKIQTVVNSANDNSSPSSNLVDEDDDSPFIYQYDTNAKTAIITGYKSKSGNDLPANLEIPASHNHNGVEYTVTSIGAHAFDSKPAPAQGVSVSLPDTIKTIGDYAFGGDNLTSINLPEGLVSIGNSAFSDTKLTNVTIPSTLETIGDAAFDLDSELTSVDMSNATSLTSISKVAFASDPKLVSLKLPSNGKLSSIGDSCFGSTAITKVEIPASVTKIGAFAFGGIGVGASVVIHSPEGAIVYVADFDGNTSTTIPYLTFSSVSGVPIVPTYVTN